MKITLALLFFFVLHSLLAANKVKARLQKSTFPSKWYRISYNLIAVITLFPTVYFFVKNTKTWLFQTPLWLTILGSTGLLAGIILLLLALSQYDLGEFSGFSYLQKKNASEVQPQLNTSGLNARVRHPLYFAMLLLLWSYFLVFPSLEFLIVSIVSSLYIYVGTKLEEQKLRLTFGENYRQYQEQIPMLIPHFKKLDH